MFHFQNEILKITVFLIIKVIQTLPFLGQDGVVAFLPIPSAKNSSDDIIKQIQEDSKRWREGRLASYLERHGSEYPRSSFGFIFLQLDTGDVGNPQMSASSDRPAQACSQDKGPGKV